jgi:hypothetical protein
MDYSRHPGIEVCERAGTKFKNHTRRISDYWQHQRGLAPKDITTPEYEGL